MRRKVLVIEDSPDIADLLALHLRDANCEVRIANDGERGLALARSSTYHLVILDLMLPHLDGLEICRALRKQAIYTPILILTAKSSEVDRVLGLEMGADDYLVKPFSIPELLARVRAIFRRVEEFARRDVSQEIIRSGGIVANIEKRTVTVDGRPVDLTGKEFDLLVQFARHPGRVYTRAQLLDLVWGYRHEGYEHTVNCHINRLRGKIEDDQRHPNHILTVWGVGYKFNDAAAS